MIAFELQEVVVAAALAVRVGVTHAGTRLVYRATPFFGVEHLADLAEVFVVLLFQRTHFFRAVKARITRFRLCVGNVEMFGQARNVALADFDQRVAAAVTRSFATVVLNSGFLFRGAGGHGFSSAAEAAHSR